MKRAFLEGGRFGAAHGIHGQIRAEVWCDSPDVLRQIPCLYLPSADGYHPLPLHDVRTGGHAVILALGGIDTREAAQALRCLTFYLRREDIPLAPGAVLIADLIGTPVTDIDTGRCYGRVKEISDGVCNRLITVETEQGDVLLPDIPEFIKERDAEGGLKIRPIPGFFDE